MSPSRDIPFNKLVLGQSNVRRVKAGVSIEELAEHRATYASNKVLSVGPSSMQMATRPACSRMPAGGRRYRALELLVKQSGCQDAAVPCVVREGGIAEATIRWRRT